jgi:hypothetical protein
MPPVGFEPTIPVRERPQTYALDRATTGTGTPRAHARARARAHTHTHTRDLVRVLCKLPGNSEEKQSVPKMFILFRVHLNSVSGLCQIVIVLYLTVLISLTLRWSLCYLSDTLDLIDSFSERAHILLRSLWSGLRVVPDRIRSAVFGNLYLRDGARRSVLLVRS